MAVSPPLLTIHEKDVFLVTTYDGEIGPRLTGLYWADTRHISRYLFTVGGSPFRLLSAGTVDYFSSLSFFTNPAVGAPPRQVPAGALLLRLERFVSDDGLHEDYHLANHGDRHVDLRLALELDGDFADIFEVRGMAPKPPRITLGDWDAAKSLLSFAYRNGPFQRSVHMTFGDYTSPPRYLLGQIEFDVRLDPGQTWHT